MKAVSDEEFQEHSELSQYYLGRFSHLIIEKGDTQYCGIYLIKVKSIQLFIYSVFDSYSLHVETRI